MNRWRGRGATTWLVAPFRNSIRRRLLLGNAAIALLLVLAGIIVIWQLDRLTGAVDTLEQANRLNLAVVAAQNDSTLLLTSLARVVAGDQPGDMDIQLSQRIEALRDSQERLLFLAGLTELGSETFTPLQRVLESNDVVLDAADAALPLIRQARWPAARDRLVTINRVQQQMSVDVEALVKISADTQRAAQVELEAARQAAIFFPSLVIALSILLGGLLLWQTMRSIAGPVEELTKGVSRLAAGELTERVPVSSTDELGQLAVAFNGMADRLERSRNELEQRVHDRTRALQATTDVGRRLTRILDPQQLLHEVVEQIKQTFGYYHVQIYNVDAADEYMRLVAGTGEAGVAMLAGGHHLRAGAGLVGRAAVTRQPTLVSDVSRDPDWLPNPMLPDTRAETAVPLVVGAEILGVLDVQHDAVGVLDEDDVAILETLGRQIAVALQNAQFFQQAQIKAEQEARLNEIGHRIQSATTVEGVLQVAARELGELLGARRTEIQLHGPLETPNGQS